MISLPLGCSALIQEGSKLSKGKSLIDHIRVEKAFENLLGKKADLITERSLSPYIAPMVKKTLRDSTMEDDAFFLRHILDAVDRIEEYTATVTYEEFLETRSMIDHRENIKIYLTSCRSS